MRWGTHRQLGRAFTLIELIAIIVVLAVLSGVAIPKYIDYTDRAKASAARAALGGIRTAIHNFHMNTAVSGTAAYPTLVELVTPGVVLHEAIPTNPYNGESTVDEAQWVPTPPVKGAFGWVYDPALGRIWMDSTTPGVDEHLW